MRKPVLVMVLCGSALSLAGSSPVEAEPAGMEISVRVYNYAAIPEATLEGGQEAAGRILNYAAIEVEWIPCPTREEDIADYAGCWREPGPRDLILRVLAGSPAKLASPSGVCGHAIVPSAGFGRIANVYFDCVEEKTWNNQAGLKGTRTATSMTLGAVIAHELGHLMLGTQTHSKAGIMKAKWRCEDFDQVRSGQLRFTLEETNKLQSNVRARMRVEQAGSR